MEEEARTLLRAALSPDDREAKGLGSAIHALFRPLGGRDVVAPPREPMREPPSFE
jgi:plasmid stability protein